MIDFIAHESLTSLNEFGAGIGQYGSETVRVLHENFVYRGYGESGDVKIYTQGQIKFIDLSVPLKLPIADCVMSFEIGHLIPHHKEGMVIRNLHAHNCKGILVSWGSYGEVDLSSSNRHDEEYILEIFTKLGYYNDGLETSRFRENFGPESDDGMWFHKSLLVLRRHDPFC